MAWLLEIGLSNTLVAALLAAIAWQASRLRFSPRIVHALWLLVLVKLITPPLVEVPVSWWAGEWFSESVWSVDLAQTAVGVTAAVWIGGACFWYVRHAVAALRFAGRLTVAPRQPAELQRQTNSLARQMGLRRAPRVLLVSAVISPMLWGLGNLARLLFPERLLGRIDRKARGTLLAHELAHFARGDHWVRLLEFVVEGLYWWNPLVAWARSSLESAEEECCDDMVVDHYAGNARRYAEALLDTIDFLADAPAQVPKVACCLGQAAALRQRLTRIMNKRAPRTTSAWHRWLLLGTALAVLSWSPSFSARAGLELKLVRDSSTPLLGPFGTGPAGTVPPGVTPARTPASRWSSPAAATPPSWGASAGFQLAVGPDHRHTARRFADGRVDLIDTLHGLRTDLTPFAPLTVAFAPHGQSFAAGCADGLVHVWACQSRELLATLDAGDDAVRSVAFTPDGQRLVTASADGLVLLWDVNSSQMLAELAHHPDGVHSAALSFDGAWLALALSADPYSSHLDGRVVLFDMGCREPFEELQCQSTVGVLGFMREGHQLLTGDVDGRWTLWDISRNQQIANVQLPPESVDAARFAPHEPALSRIAWLATAGQQLSAADRQPVSVESSIGTQPAGPLSPQGQWGAARSPSRVQ